MNLAEIRNAGGFIPAEPVKVEIKWKEHTFDVWVKRLSFGEVENLHAAEGGPNIRRMISAAILLGEDKEPITYEEAFQLEVSLAMVLIDAFNSVNNIDQKKTR